MKLVRYTIVSVMTVWFFATSCLAGDVFTLTKEEKELSKKKPVYPQTRFLAVTDTHFYSTSLGTEGKAFQDYLDNDRKLLVESEKIVETVFDELSRITADFVIVSGDLTKDGEKINHEKMSIYLRKLALSGKKVFVVPGNHDVYNWESVRFDGEATEAVANVTAMEFEKIYREFGYETALERDLGSLSYITEPVPGLWLLALDSCRWKENKPGEHPITAGAFSDDTLQWIKKSLVRSRKEDKAVIVFMHHGIVEHYPHNDKFYSDYIVSNHDEIAKMVSTFGVSLVFSGHFHSQDITLQKFKDPDRTLFDIETGSLVTAPCPYRIVNIMADQKIEIESRFLSSIPSRTSGFKEYSSDYVYKGTIKLADSALKKYCVSKEDRQLLTSQISKAYVTHLKGDEIMPDQAIIKDGLGLWGKFVMFMQEDLIYGWYTDLPPADNNLVVDLSTGEYFPK